jgi:hypothetical protein
MCDLAFVNFLREKVRNQEAEERRTAIFGITPRRHFVPWIMPKAAATNWGCATCSEARCAKRAGGCRYCATDRSGDRHTAVGRPI